jgi:hypothetical protein
MVKLQRRSQHTSAPLSPHDAVELACLQGLVVERERKAQGALPCNLAHA